MRSRTLSTQVGKKTDADVVITEIGGTTGDIESQPFLEAIRQVAHEVGTAQLPVYPCDARCRISSGSNEHKSKPTQHSVKELQGMRHPCRILSSPQLMSRFPDAVVFRKDRAVLQCQARTASSRI